MSTWNQVLQNYIPAMTKYILSSQCAQSLLIVCLFIEENYIFVYTITIFHVLCQRLTLI